MLGHERAREAVATYCSTKDAPLTARVASLFLLDDVYIYIYVVEKK